MGGSAFHLHDGGHALEIGRKGKPRHQPQLGAVARTGQIFRERVMDRICVGKNQKENQKDNQRKTKREMEEKGQPNKET